MAGFLQTSIRKGWHGKKRTGYRNSDKSWRAMQALNSLQEKNRNIPAAVSFVCVTHHL
jgi:hypothetical protein